ncbi:hypothetical protein D9V41_10545 [Aeromicrobium phragmitis]|uniref:Glycolipid-binding domain-containing protein n=1 Tax=Aeromicrobium phragmitis TaxID=2478914 RepID=A0A3L8PN97_9ACTN|nr:putative glycolipid-binding domain-containing protein [Aeromicrobium phragmitis]RLV55522.1 hypothetical protein D9V41_10545 [Aeromicrobium phragmitis]
MRRRDVAWSGVDADSHEICRLEVSDSGVVASGSISGPSVSCTYSVTTTPDWQFRSLTLNSHERELQVDFDGVRWCVNHEERSDLADATEVDLSVSPFSNTLPIRRLALAPGDRADILTAYVTVPDLVVTTDPQRYTRLSEDEYLYESRDSDFSRTISVDADGLVVTYPGLFQQEATSI